MNRPTSAAMLLLGSLAFGACANTNPSDTTPARGPTAADVTAPSTTTDPGSRFLDAEAPLGAITVETQPVDGAWANGQTSIARPAPGSPYASGQPDLPPPETRSPTPPPPPPLR